MSTLSDEDLFLLCKKHARATLDKKGWDFPGPNLYLINATMRLHGLDCKIAGQLILPGTVGVTGKPLSLGQNFAIAFPSGEVFNAQGLRGWSAIWNRYQEVVGSGDWDTRKGQIQDMPPNELVNFRRQLKGVEPGKLDALVPQVLACVHQDLLQIGTQASASPLRPGARL